MRKKQVYWLMLHARIDEAVGAEERHAKFFEGISDLPEPWGVGDRPFPTSPDFKRSSCAVVSLTKFFGSGSVRSAMLNYQYRRLLRDDGLSDDLLNVIFYPEKVDLHQFIYNVVPRFIESFDAYLAECFDDNLIGIMSQEQKGLPVNPRSIVHNVHVVSFFDELLCRRAFNLSPSEVMARLQGTIEHVQLLHGGVYLVGSSKLLPLDEARDLCSQMKKAIIG